MEALAIATGALTLLGACGKTASTLERLLSIRDIPEQAAWLVNEMSSLRSAIKAVELSLRTVDDSHDPSVQAVLCEVERILQQIRGVLQSLDDLIKNELLRGKKVQDDVSRLPEASIRAWIRKEKRIVALRNQLSMMRENLLAAHMSLNTTIGRSNQVALSQVVQIVQNISSPAVPPVSAPGTSDPTILLQLERIITMMLERPLPPPQARALASSSRPSSKHTNEPQHDVQVHGSNDSNTPAMSNRPPNHPKARQTLIKIESTLDVKCNNPCTCQCHIRTSVKSPLWARFLIGSFFYQATGRVFIGSGSCDSRCCQKTTSSQVRLTYYAPSWLGWKPLVMSATNNSLPGLNSTISLRVPDFVPWDNPLWDLIYEGDVTGLQRYMSKYRVNPNTVEEFGRSLLFAAVGYCQHEISTFLVQEGADPLHQDVNGISPLHQGLQEFIADTEVSDKTLRTVNTRIETLFSIQDPLDEYELSKSHYIVLGFDETDLDFHLNQHPSNRKDVNCQDSSGATPLSWAAIRGDPDHIRTLILHGAHVDLADKSGYSPIHNAAFTGTDECVEILLRAGASATCSSLSNGNTPLHSIAYSGIESRIDSIKSLIEHGADVNARDRVNGSTPLHHCCQLGLNHVDISLRVRCLLDHHADINARDDDGCTALVMAVQKNAYSLIPLLLDAGAQPEISSYKGLTILHMAALWSTVETMEALIQAGNRGQLSGVDVHAQDSDGNTCFDFFYEYRDRRFFKNSPKAQEEEETFRRLVESCQVKEEDSYSDEASSSDEEWFSDAVEDLPAEGEGDIDGTE